MNNKYTNLLLLILNGAGILLLLASAFDLIPKLDNLLVFLGIACFIALGIVRKASRSCGSK